MSTAWALPLIWPGGGMGRADWPGRMALKGLWEDAAQGPFLGASVQGGEPPCDLPCLLSFPAPLPRYHNVGILVLFLHDISDVQLEFTKLNVYFKSRGGSHHPLHALAADLGCLSFSLSW